MDKAQPLSAQKSFAIDSFTVFSAVFEDEALSHLSPNEKRNFYDRIVERLEALGWVVISAGPMNPGYPKSREPLRQLSEIMDGGKVGAYAEDLMWRINAVHEYAELSALVNRQAFAPYPITAKNKTQSQTEKMLALAAKHQHLRRVFCQLAWLMSQASSDTKAFCERLEAAYLDKVKRETASF